MKAKAILLLAATVATLAPASATVSESDRQPSRNPDPTFASHYISIREHETKKAGERTTSEVLVRNHHPSRTISVEVSITWNAGTRDNTEKRITVVLKPGEERSVHRIYPKTHDFTDQFVTSGPSKFL